MLRANLVSVFLQMQNSTSPEVRASAPQASQAFAQLSVGQAVTASIVSQLAAGLYLADLGGKPIQLGLPVMVVPGDTLSLRVLRAQPDFVFELLPRSDSGPSAASNPLTTLSRGAQIIRLALGDTYAMTTAQPFAPSAPPSSLAPLLPLGPQVELPAHQLATALQTVVEHSGLFYESHLAAWTRGQRTIAELQREPQTQWRAPAGASAVPASGRNPEQVDVRHGAVSFAREATPDAARAAAGNDSVHARAYVLPLEARPMLREQLEALETRRIAWQGQVWPGQRATLAIAEERAEEDPQEGETAHQPTWRTTLDLVLAQLGGIHAELVACGDAIRISIRAPEPASVRLLQSGLPALDERLRAAGLQPLRLRVMNRG